MTPERKTETGTIRCEACRGQGWYFDIVLSADPSQEYELAHRDCWLCSGTGREPSSVQPRQGEGIETQ